MTLETKDKVRQEITTGSKGFFGTREKLLSYKKWKENVSSDFRQIVESHLQGKDTKMSKSHTPLVRQLYEGLSLMLNDPDLIVDNLEMDIRVKKQLETLQKTKINENGDRVNVFKIMANKAVDFSVRQDYFYKKIKSRIDWLSSQDKKDLEKYNDSEENAVVTGSDEDDEYEPHRQPNQEQEGEPTEAIATVYPFFGGYYKDAVFSNFDPQTLKWSKETAKFQNLVKQEISEDKKRVYRTVIKSGKKEVIKVPYNWGVDQESVKFFGSNPLGYDFYQDGNGLSYIQVNGDNAEYQVQLEIGPTSVKPEITKPSKEIEKVTDIFSPELEQFVISLQTAKITNIQKCRKLVSFIRDHLEYDKDDASLDVLYKQDISQYFAKIWENKKAKCDEANTMAVRALLKAGFIARFISGHSVQGKSNKGEALLLENNRHAWCEVWNEENNSWLRLDATPKGDPNVDEEEQEEDLEGGEGDYGEQDAELMTDEDLGKALADLQKQETKSLTPEEIFVKEAGCTPEEARRVLDKISFLREKYKKELNESYNYWKKVLRKNIKESFEYSGPVRQSEGYELFDPVEARIDLRVGENDPGGFEKQVVEKKVEKLFGGYEVYIMADMSGSMAEYLGGVQKAEMQRDMVFLLMDSIMRSATMSRKAETKLKVPMPNKVCLTVFGATTEIVLPTTDKWGPVEQIRVYRALDKGADGSTPDSVALAMIKKQIENSREEENKKTPKKKSKTTKMHRFVIATADGGSDNYAQVKQVNDELQQMGIPVDLFLLGYREDERLLSLARQTYQSVTGITDVRELAGKCLDTLTTRIKEIYGK